MELDLGFWGQVLRITVPYLLCALGAVISERSGVICLGVEGMLLGGAFSAALGAHLGHAVAWGVLAGAGGGVLLAGIYALVVLRLRADQIVAGVALNLLALGATRYLLKLIFHSASSSAAVPGFGADAWVPGFIVGAALLALAVHFVFVGTPGGLRLRAVGESAETADSLGVAVGRVRLLAVLASGAAAGLGGAWLALDNHGFVDRMSGGRGYIAIAAMILGRWHPVGAAAACLFFGYAETRQLRMQAMGGALPRELVQILPYVLTIVALLGVSGRVRPPASLGKPAPRR